MDDDGSKALNEEEFITGIRDIGLDVTEDEIKQMFNTWVLTKTQTECIVNCPNVVFQ